MGMDERRDCRKKRGGKNRIEEEMIRISQIKVPLEHSQRDIVCKAAKILRIDAGQIQTLQIVKKSVDARKKPDIAIIYTADVTVEAQGKVLGRCRDKRVQEVHNEPYRFPPAGTEKMEERPVIIGTGPAGLFCGYMLAKYGFAPILLERGKPVEERRADVERFWSEGVLIPDSNVQFGEGGAGTFSDGKLSTLVKDKFGRSKEVLRIFVEAGAPEKILYEAKPHIGTDILMNVVANLRRQIMSFGGEVRFGSKVTELKTDGKKVSGVVINDREFLRTDVVVLAVGHSARDTFAMLYEKGIPMEAKAFAVGLRMEHPQKLIDTIQYGVRDEKLLPPADYKVTAKTKSGRGVYSFCMCPGGYVVNASSEAGGIAVNGMSYSARDGENGNSAMIVTVTPEDYGASHPLSGIEFQRKLEKKAYEIGQGAVPVQAYGDFRAAVMREEAPAASGKEAEAPTHREGLTNGESMAIDEYDRDFAPKIKGAYRMAQVHKIMPSELNQALVEGIDLIGQTMKGFADGRAYLSGIESRTSSPVRILRGEDGQSEAAGLYPCGEGAGYAGGIMSAAMDGIGTAEKIAAVYRQFDS